MTIQLPKAFIDTIISSVDIVNHEWFNDDPDNSGVYFFVEVAIGLELYTAVVAGETTKHDYTLRFYEEQLPIENNLAALRAALLDLFGEHVDDATTLMQSIEVKMQAVCSTRWNEILAEDYAAKA